MKTITDQLAAELNLDSTTLCILMKITIQLPGSSAPVKTIRVTTHDQDINFIED